MADGNNGRDASVNDDTNVLARLARAERELVEAKKAAAGNSPAKEGGSEEKLDPTVMLDDKPVSPIRSTVFSYMSTDYLPDKKLRRGILLALEAVIYVGASLAIARALGLEESGVFSIFLSSPPY
jgi:hypothetical protein